ncbi:UDENN domain-containing protein [Entamoeba marina]
MATNFQSSPPTNLKPVYSPLLLLQAYYLNITERDNDPLHIDIKTGISSGDETDIPELLYFIYPDVPEITSANQLLHIKPLRNSFISTNQSGKRYYYFISRWTSNNTPKVLILVSSRYSILYNTLLENLQNSCENGNIESDFEELKQKLFPVGDITTAMPHIQALLKVIEPFEWQGILIPILPEHKSYAGFAGCPTPMIFGSTQNTFDNILELYKTVDYNIVDLETGDFIQRMGGLNLFAFPETGRLLNQLQYIMNETPNLTEEFIANSFSQLYLDLFGRYFAYFEVIDGTFSFNQTTFTKQSPTDLQVFLTAFSQSQMFEQFIQHRINYITVNPEFRQTIFVDCPLFKPTQKPPFKKLRDISKVPKQCMGCYQKIELDQAVVIYGNQLLFHSHCLRCRGYSFDRRCTICEENDICDIKDQYLNDMRWEQCTKQKRKIETVEHRKFTRLIKNLSFYKEKEEILKQENAKQQQIDMTRSSLFLNGTTGSIHASHSQKIGTFKAILNPEDSRKTILVAHGNEQASVPNRISSSVGNNAMLFPGGNTPKTNPPGSPVIRKKFPPNKKTTTNSHTKVDYHVTVTF